MSLPRLSQIVAPTSAFLKKLNQLTVRRKYDNQSTISTFGQLNLFRQMRWQTQGIIILLLTIGFSLFTSNSPASNLLGLTDAVIFPPPTNQKTFVGYFESWSEPWAANPQQLQLAKIAPYVNVVIVSFMNPNATYKGNYNLDGTGLEFNVDGKVVKDAIALLKTRNRNTKVLLGVGGAKYRKNFSSLNPTVIANVVKDFGFDGVDIDYEPYDFAQCTGNPIHCNTDTELRGIVKKIYTALNEIPPLRSRRYLVTLAAWSVGAYGEGQWINSPPKSSMTGFMLNLLRSPEASMIDILNVMSYNAGTVPSEYNPQDALAAYQNYFKGKVVMGVSVPPEVGGTVPNVYTLTKVRELTQAVVNRNADGIMLWSLQKQPDGTPTENNPNAQMIAQTVCKTLSLGSCSNPLFSSN